MRWRTRNDNPLVPPARALRAAGIGGGDYVAVGCQFLEYFKDFASLGRHDAVLEIGCGIGRMAGPLTTWLQEPGRYEGFDVVRSSVSWCTKTISPRYPRFHFQCLDVANSLYNPRGRLRPEDLAFPFADGSFDVIIGVSVFTHMLPDAVSRYLREARRVLRPGGRLFATWFVWHADVPATEDALQLFPVDCDSHRVARRDKPEAVVAIPESLIVEIYRLAGLNVTRTVEGNWRRGVHALPYQDMIIASTPSTEAVVTGARDR